MKIPSSIIDIGRFINNHNCCFSGNALTCFCLGHCPHFPNDPSRNGTCEAKPGAKCFAAVEEVFDPNTGLYVPERTYGCVPPDETGMLQCKGHLVPHLNPKSIGKNLASIIAMTHQCLPIDLTFQVVAPTKTFVITSCQ